MIRTKFYIITFDKRNNAIARIATKVPAKIKNILCIRKLEESFGMFCFFAIMMIHKSIFNNVVLLLP
jgi:hypothetical protein